MLQQQQQYNNTNLLGNGPMDWLVNAATFGGTDALLNRVDDEEHKHHFWRNAGLAGALALGYQYYRNHHNNNQMAYQYVYPQQQTGYYPQQQAYYYPQQQQAYYSPYQQQQAYSPYPYMPQTGFPANNMMGYPSTQSNFQIMGQNPMTPYFPQQQMMPFGYPHHHHHSWF
ncbi:hypothetical protein K501DRAFT_289042 [Backusella circina FSU 941]|nr:hypothetical protein K501DRAFT_289042 [Backusella circina FSU 941]